MTSGIRKTAIATTMLAASGAIVTIGGVQTASAHVPRDSGSHHFAAGTQTMSTKNTSGTVSSTRAASTHANSAGPDSAKAASARAAATKSNSVKSWRNGRSGSHQHQSVRSGSAMSDSTDTAQQAADSVSKTSGASSKGKVALQFAKKQLGKPYKFAAAGPGAYDCSGLTMKAWESAGVNLPHSAEQQYTKGTRVSKENLKPGDLVFFYDSVHHVGIYAGHDKVIDAPNSSTPVRTADMTTMPIKGATRLG